VKYQMVKTRERIGCEYGDLKTGRFGTFQTVSN
jgi:hypothetical protein